jgi:myosin heavy subunit
MKYSSKLITINTDSIKNLKTAFSYQFSNVQKETEFRLFSNQVTSEEFTLDVLKKPNVLGFEVELDYPSYTQRKDEKLESIGDLVVPMGTNIDWVFNAQNTDDIQIQFGDDALQPIKRFADELFTFKKQAKANSPYKLFISNQQLPNADSISYSLTVIPDLYPTISVEKFQDSTDNKLLFFVGQASDDYGLRRLSFNYQINKGGNGAEGKLNTVGLGQVSGKQAQYDYTFDLNEIELAPGDEISYYFEIFDNDGINGSKSARTNPMIFAMPTVEEFEAMEEENDEKIKDDLMKALKESKDIQQEMKKMREKLLQEKDLDWQDREELEKLLDRQKELEKKIDEAKQSYEENLKNQEEFSKQDEEIMEKQEKLQELFEDVMSEEMQELMQKIEELMQELEKDEALEMMEDMEMNDEELEMELDRMLELFKQLELEKEMTDAIEKLEELAEKQEELSEETEKGEKPQEELKEEQEEINEEFEDLKEKMDDIEKKNEELEKPKDIGDRDEQMEDIQEDLNDSQEQLDQQQNSKASESQKKASQKMKDMAAAMQMQMESGEMEQMEEDMAALRQLLENLVGLSFDQERLIDDFGLTNVNTPRYTDLVQQQFKLKDDFRLVEDSLQALSKRVFQIESFVTEKVTEIKSNIRESLDELEERKKPQASEHQQRTMTNVNDLALMLSEVMSQMQQQMSGMMAGAQMCNNPGNKSGGKSGQKPSDKISEGQKGLNEQMKKMKEGLEKGQGGTSKEFAQMAAKQAALRKALREKNKKLQEQGKGDKQLQELIEQMDKVETDLVNKKLTNEVMKRQEEILTRLLQHEKAERQRELDQKRKAEVASQKKRQMPPSLEEYIKKRKAEVEMYKSVSPSLKPYYKFLVDEYFKNLKEES